MDDRCARREVADVAGPDRMGQVALVEGHDGGLAGLTHVFTPEACEALNLAGDTFRDLLNAAIAARGLPLQVSGHGSMNCVHFTREPLLRPVHDPLIDRKRGLLHLDMIAAGIYLARRGMMNLSLPMTGEDVQTAVAAFENFLDSRHSVFADTEAVS